MKEHINFQIIKQAGKPAFAVVPYDEFLTLYPQAEENDGIPHEIIRNMIHKDISRIRAWREHLGFTQKEIAKKMSISQAAYSQIEAVNSKPRKATIEKIAKIFRITIDQVL